MLIMIEKSKCKHLKDLSYYNHNVYELPFQIDNCNYIQEIFDEVWGSIVYNFGFIRNGKFISSFQVDSECNSSTGNYMIVFNALIAT